MGLFRTSNLTYFHFRIYELMTSIVRNLSLMNSDRIKASSYGTTPSSISCIASGGSPLVA